MLFSSVLFSKPGVLCVKLVTWLVFLCPGPSLSTTAALNLEATLLPDPSIINLVSELWFGICWHCPELPSPSNTPHPICCCYFLLLAPHLCPLPPLKEKLAGAQKRLKWSCLCLYSFIQKLFVKHLTTCLEHLRTALSCSRC